MKKIIEWFSAEDVSNQMGFGCLVSAFRIGFAVLVLIVTLMLYFFG